MHLRRLLLLASGLVLLVAPPAAAQYGDSTDATVSDSTPAPGEPVTASGSGFESGEEVTFVLSGGASRETLGTDIADANGVASLTFDAPTTCARYTTSLTGNRSGRTASTSFTVTGCPSATGAGGLPETGSSSSVPIAQLGVVLAGAGALLLLLARRRVSARRSNTAA